LYLETNVYSIKVNWAEGACGAAAIVLKSGEPDMTGKMPIF